MRLPRRADDTKLLAAAGAGALKAESSSRT
jgi:hypothetical protein